MRIYWTLGSLPELADVPRRERGRLWRRNVRHGFRHGRFWAGLLVIPGTAMGLALWLAPIVSDSILGRVVFAATLGGLGGLIGSQLMVRAVRPYLRPERRSRSER